MKCSLNTLLPVAALSIFLCLSTHLAFAQSASSGITLQRLSLPRGPGSIEGLGESFEPELATGSAQHEVKLDIPDAAGGFAPCLILSYNSNLGLGPFGLGWSVNLESVQRQTDKGIPSFSTTDTFVCGGEELVELTNGSFLGENCKDYSRYRIVGNGWEKTLPSGIKHNFGENADARETRTKDDTFDGTFRWLLSSSVDLHGNRIEYHYRTIPGSPGIQYLSTIRYGFQKTEAKNFHEVVFSYGESSRPSTSYASGYRRSTNHFCHQVAINTTVNGVSKTIRRYDLEYVDGTPIPLIQSITQFDANGNKLPPIKFSYLPSRLGSDDQENPGVLLSNIRLPTQLQHSDIAFCDLNRDGLTDICFSVPGLEWSYHLNSGNLSFTESFELNGIPTSLNLRDQKTQFIDITGDGWVDLLTTVPDDDGNTRVAFYELNVANTNATTKMFAPYIEPSQKQVFENTCSIDLSTDGVRLFDLDFNKCVDFTRILDDSLLVATNRPDSRGARRWKQFNVPFSESSFPGQTVSPTMRMADVNGDRLMDFVDLFQHDGTLKVTCYFGMGDGHFAEGLPLPFMVGGEQLDVADFPTSNLSTFHFADVNSDGASDLVHVIPGNVRVWASAGELFEEPVDWRGPNFRSSTQVMLVDMNGNGSSDVVFLDTQANDKEQLKVLDCFPTGRGNLLSGIDNGIGGVTKIEYRSSTDYYLAALNADHPWESLSPIPVHAVSRVTLSNSLDLDQDGKVDLGITDIIYRDPYYDGREKQFRGFSSVTRIEWGDDFTNKRHGTASTVTRRRYHTGGPDGVGNDEFNHVAGAEEEPLKGKLLWEELCSLDAIDRNAELTYAWPKVSGQGDGLDNDGDGTVDNLAEGHFCHNDLVYRRTINRWKLRILYDNKIAPPKNNHLTKVPLRIVRDAQIDKAQIQSIEGPNVALLAPSQRDKHPPRWIETEFEFNEFGGMTRKTELGVVAPNQAKDSQRTNMIEYAHNGTALEQWTLDRVARSTHSDKGGKIVRAERHFYGDSSNKFDVLPLFSIGSRALKIRTDALLIPNSQDGLPKDKIDDASNWVQRSIQGYDPFGNVSWLLDGMADSSNPQKGHSRTLEYDPIFNAFPISETVFVANGKQLRAKASFDVSFGVMTSLVDFLEIDEVELQDTVAGERVGQPRKVKGAATLLQYDSHARLTKLIRPGDSLEKPTEEYAYILADPINKLQYSYDSKGGLTLRSINGDWTVSLGDANGSVKLDEGLSAVVTWKRDKSGELETVGSVSLTDGLGRSLAKVSENSGDKNLFLESYLLDVRGNASQLMQPYESDGWQPTTQARRQLFKRDPLGRVYQTYHPADSNGVVATSSTTYLPQSRRVYDEEDNLLGGKHEGTFTDFEEDGFNRLAKVTQFVRLDDEGHSTNQLNSWQTVYEYDLLDNLVAVSDAQKNVSYHRYDSLGRRRTINDPDRGVATFEYDLADNLLLKTDARDAKIRIEYDGANRKLIEEGSFNGQIDSITFHYDVPKQGLKDPLGAPLQPANCLGRLAWVEDLAGEEHYSYTPRGTVNWTLRRFNAEGENRVYLRAEEFDAQDRRTNQRVVSHDGNQLKVVSQYNKRGLIQAFDMDQAEVVGFEYHPNGVVSTTNNANGTRKHVELDHRLRLRHLQVTSPNGGNQQKLIDNEYSYDQASNLLRIDDLRPPSLVPLGDPLRNTQVFSLDDAYRLRSANYFTGATNTPAATKVEYRFDRIGNRLEMTAAGALPDDPFWKSGLGKSINTSRSNRNGATAGQPGPHAITSTDGGSKLAFDDAGATTNYDGKVLIRDAWGHIRQVVDAAGNKIAKYQYSHNGERLLKVTDDRIRYPFPEVRDSANAGLQYYIMIGDERLVCFEGGKHFFLHRDQMGSLILTTDNNAAVTEEINYMPYGATRSEKVNAASGFTSHYRFSGNEYDAESGMHFFRNRSLIGGLGSFASCDPVILSHKHKYLSNPISQNPYLYSLANPGRYTDPNGDLAFVPVILGAIALDMLLNTTPANAPGIGDEVFPAPTIGEQLFWEAASAVGAHAVGHALRSVKGLLRPSGEVVGHGATGAKGIPENLGPFGSKAPKQVSPGTKVLEGHHIDDFGRSQPWRAHYDQYGRQTGRTDFNAGNKAAGVPDVHHHKFEYNSQFPNGRESGSHLPGEFVP